MLEKVAEKAGFKDLFVVIISSIALVSFWRGIWGLLDIYLFPNDPNLSFLVSAAIGLFIFYCIAQYKRRPFGKEPLE